MAVSAAWDLTKTASGAFEFGREAVIAATRDHVQPFALAACESFGATLAICPETRLKVQHTLAEVADPVYLKFLKAQIGFERGSSVEILSRSMDGVRFLALAAALVSSMEPFHAANVLETMIEASAADKTFLPTSYHLKILLQLIEPRLNRVGFTTDVLGWMTFLRHHPDITGPDLDMAVDGQYACPWLEEFKLIVEAFRSLARLGDADEIVIHSQRSIPWLIAFTKWCLGMPPKIRNAEGIMILDQPGARVTVQIYQYSSSSQNRDPNSRIRVEVWNTARSLLDLFEVEKNVYNNGQIIPFRGMVSPRTHGRHILENANRARGLERLAILEALPHALQLVRNRLLFLPDRDSMPYKRMVKVAFQLRARLGSWSAYIPCPFPAEEKILATMAEYVSVESPERIETSSKITSLRDFLFQQTANFDSENIFGQIVANIFALSLIDGPLESVLVSYVFRPDSDRNLLDHTFELMVRGFLFGGEIMADMAIDCILGHTLFLLGQEVTSTGEDWVLSSFHGQVVFPKIFQTEVIPRTGYLELCCVPGNLSLRAKDRQVSKVVSKSKHSGYGYSTHDIKVTRSLNLYPDADLQWIITVEEDFVTARLKSTAEDCSQITVSPFSVLRGVAKSVFISTCPHPENRTLDEPLLDCSYVGPPAAYFGDTSRIRVVPVKGHKRLRMLAIATDQFGKGSVVINHACLACAAEICRALRFSRIVC